MWVFQTEEKGRRGGGRYKYIFPPFLMTVTRISSGCVVFCQNSDPRLSGIQKLLSLFYKDGLLEPFVKMAAVIIMGSNNQDVQKHYIQESCSANSQLPLLSGTTSHTENILLPAAQVNTQPKRFGSAAYFRENREKCVLFFSQILQAVVVGRRLKSSIHTFFL